MSKLKLIQTYRESDNLVDWLQRLVGTVAEVENWREVGGSNNPAFENSWVNFDSTRKARFYKDPYGVVHLAGLIKTGAITDTAFTLPSGYIPDYLDSINQNMHISTTSNLLFGEVIINYQGEVIPNVGSSTWVSLNGVSFRV